MRIPAIYRNNDGDEGAVTKTLVWIVDLVVVESDEPRAQWHKHELRAVSINRHGSLSLAPAWMLEVLPWTDEDTALDQFRPPDDAAERIAKS